MALQAADRRAALATHGIEELASRPPSSIEPAVLQRLRAMLDRDGIRPGNVGDGTCNTYDAIVTTRGEPQPRHRVREQTLGLGRQRTQPSQESAADLGIQARGSASCALALARVRDPSAHGGRVVPTGRADELLALERGQLHLKIDAIEQRA